MGYPVFAMVIRISTAVHKIKPQTADPAQALTYILLGGSISGRNARDRCDISIQCFHGRYVRRFTGTTGIEIGGRPCMDYGQNS